MTARRMSRIAENLQAVRDRIAAAAKRSGRTAEDVTLVAVTKYVDLMAIQALVEAGCTELGESRPQALWSKAAAIGDWLREARPPQAREVRWHMIGHLQRNKVEQTLPLVSLVHSGDSLRLITALDQAASKIGRKASVLIEVNVSGDETKHGFRPDEIEPLLPQLAALEHVAIPGLMCMAAREGDEDVARRNFVQLRELRDRLRKDAPARISLDELSMGMSDDYEIAIEEGATIVRVGSALFEGID